MARSCRTVLALLFLLAATPGAADVGRPQDWQDRFSLPIADQAVTCAIEYRGELYVGGRFEVIGGSPARHVARWDGGAWRDVGGGLPSPVWALAAYEDALVAGASTGVMRWDGGQWTALGDGSPAFVSALLATDAGLVAGGGSSLVGANVARWDGTRWSAMGAGLDDGVSALAEFQGSVYAGGTFDSSAATRVAGIARWNGASWEPVGEGVAGEFGSAVYHLTVHDGALVAGGLFTRVGTLNARFLARWDGTRWDSLPPLVPPRAAGVAALASWNDTLYASTGGVALARWAGADWDLVDGLSHARRLVATSKGLIVVGAERRDTGTGQLRGRDVLAWDGAWHTFEAWTGAMHGLLPPAYDGYDHRAWDEQPVRDLTTYRDQLWVVPNGPDVSAGQPPGWMQLGKVARWDGDAWHDESPPGMDDPVLVVAADDMLLAAGLESHPSFGSTLATHDGSGWTTLPRLSGWVTALGRWRDAWYAATRDVHSDQCLLRRWEGIARGWQQVGSFGPGYPHIQEIVAFGDTLVCGGRFESVNGTPASSLAGFDGSRWFALRGGASPTSSVSSLTVYDGRLWCASAWEGLGSRSSLAVLEHGTWNPVATPGTVIGLAEHRGHLFANTILGFDRGLVMMWDGARWEGLAGSPSLPNLIASTPGGLYVAGPFTSAGGRPSYGLALWQGEPGAHVARGVGHLAPPWPNPAGAGANIAFTLPRSGRVRVTVLDLRGALVAELADGDHGAGSHFLSWDFVDRSGRRVPPGVYLVRLMGPGIDEARRIVRI